MQFQQGLRCKMSFRFGSMCLSKFSQILSIHTIFLTWPLKSCDLRKRSAIIRAFVKPIATSRSIVNDVISFWINSETLKTSAIFLAFRKQQNLTSPIPRPGIFPPTLNGSLVSTQVFPWSVDRRIDPKLGSHSLVYIPTATYRRLVSTGSVASASMPQSCLPY